ncbi:MAG TPA: hypothetical protein VMW47_09345 [Verrucomicrobiae bacterium]|nr:hypothetical protein [Verrucomicrobiae bacterium]
MDARFLLRHPLTAVVLGLVVLFVVFFLILPALSVLLHLVVAVAIVWAAVSLFRAHRHHRSQSRP